MFTEIIALVSVVIAAIATYFAIRQTDLNRKALQAQTFVTIVNTARDIHFSEGMDIIRSLNYDNYEKFMKSESKKSQAHIREIIDFLNDLSHMVKHGYLTEEHVLNIYFVSIMDCSERLLPWWVEGFRQENNNQYYYYNFEQLCKRIHEIGDERLLQWNSKDTPK